RQPSRDGRFTYTTLFRSVNGRWNWSAGADIANRNSRNVSAVASPAERTFFTGSTSLAGRLRFERTLARVAERRFTLDSSAEARADRKSTRLTPVTVASRM